MDQETPELDATQRAVVDLPDDASAAVLGAPGTGKSTTLVEVVADRILTRGWEPREVLALAPSRAAAATLRDLLGRRIPVATDGPLARTAASLAVEIVGTAARAAGQEPPRLLTGAVQDSDLAILLEGDIADGAGPVWPDPLGPDVRRTARFRSELRDLFARATEQGLGPRDLAALGRATDRPAWVAAGEFFDEYLDVVASLRVDQRDPAEFARMAEQLLDAGRGGARVDALRLVVVDDLPEATEATLRLLAALARRGVAIIALGDPDVATNAFRGGEPDALGRLAAVLGRPDIPTLTLGTAYRPSGPVRALTAAVASRVGAAAAGAQRRAVAEREPSDPAGRPPLARIEAPTAARVAAAVARVLREEHLLAGVPWRRLAVVVRSGASVPTLARALALAEVPTRTLAGGAALRDDAAARALLTVVEVGRGMRELSADVAAELLTSPFGGLDQVGLRRLRLALRAEEAMAGGRRPATELLVEALAAPGRFATIDAPFARIAERLASTLDALRRAPATATAEELLWTAWERARLAAPWRAQALSSGLAAAEANRDLDGVVALFAAARRFAEHRDDAPAAEVFFAQLRDAAIDDDLIVPTRSDDAVLVTTPSGAVGIEVETVVIAGLQDGAWPNLRPRGTLVDPQALPRAAAGAESPLDARRLVLDDELRMFALAVSRARERVILASVANDDEAPSPLIHLLPPDAPLLPEAAPLTLRGLTGRLRRLLSSRGVDPRVREQAASTLARLAREGVPGADPAEWHGLLEPSTSQPLFEGEQVPISPSRLERFEESPLDWFLETIGGTALTVSMDVGTILHWAMETATAPDAAAVWERVEQRWAELLFDAPWIAEHYRRSARVLSDAIAAYLGDAAARGATVVGAERQFTLDVDRARVRGSIDRVEREADGRVVIVDLKTGTPVTKAEKVAASAQLGAYQLAYREGLLDEALAGFGPHESGGAKLLFVKSGADGRPYREGVQPPLDEVALEGFRDRIRQAAIGMAAASFEGAIEVGGYGIGAVPELRLHRVGPVSGA